MKPYSIDLRQRVLDAADRGISRRQIVEMFVVSLSTVKRYLKLRSQIGQLAPKPIPGRTPTKGAVLATDLPSQLAAHHDFALEQHCKLWAISHGVVVACGGYLQNPHRTWRAHHPLLSFLCLQNSLESG